jgi:hypothetical protein
MIMKRFLATSWRYQGLYKRNTRSQMPNFLDFRVRYDRYVKFYEIEN